MKVALSKFTRANFEKLKFMHPVVQKLFTEFYCRIAMEGIYIRIPDDGGKRTGEEQRALYNKVPRVTWVLCPMSWHCHGLALDIVPLSRIGIIEYKAIWDSAYYERIAKIAMGLGIQWGYALWGVDKPHFHYTGGLTLEQVAAGAFIPSPQFTPAIKPPVLVRALGRLGIPLP